MKRPSTDPWTAIPAVVGVVEVGPRDGFQNIDAFVPTDVKIRIVNRLLGLGFDRVEVTSFVHPQSVPQMRDAEAVAAAAQRGGARTMALVPNRRGTQRAADLGLDMLDFVLSATESHNRANTNASVAESLDEMAGAIELATAMDIPVRMTIATAFGCPFEGYVDPDRVLELAHLGADMGAAEICLGDTTGMANPRQVAELFRRLAVVEPNVPAAVHLHDTRGAAAANLLAALESGVAVFDASVGGMGGCPYAPGATGNVCTEDMVNMLHQMGVRTGVDLDGLVQTALQVESDVGIRLPGQVMRAGPTPIRPVSDDHARPSPGLIESHPHQGPPAVTPARQET